MGSAGDQSHLALTVTAHGNSFSSGGSTVVNGSIGNVHTGQLADHGLVLENGLQNTLAHLSLIGSVSSQELFLSRNVLDDAGDVVVISTGATQNGGEYAVLIGHSGHCTAHFQLAHALGDLQIAILQQHFSGDVLVQFAVILQADGLQHFKPFLLGGRNITCHINPPWSWPRRLQRPAVPQKR